MRNIKCISCIVILCVIVALCSCTDKKNSSATKAEKETSTEKVIEKCILPEAAQVAEINYYSYTGEDIVINDAERIQRIIDEIKSVELKEEDIIPFEELLEGGLPVNLILENGEVISFGCGDNFIGFDGNQYDVETDIEDIILNETVGYILTEEEAEQVVEIYYYTLAGERVEIVESERIRTITDEIRRIKLGDALPSKEWREGGLMMYLVMEDGKEIPVGCGGTTIVFNQNQYDVEENDLYTLIIEE